MKGVDNKIYILRKVFDEIGSDYGIKWMKNRNYQGNRRETKKKMCDSHKGSFQDERKES